MPITNASLVLAAGRYLRQHPDATDEELAAAVGLDLRQGDRDRVIKPARQNVAADAGEARHLGGGGWQPPEQ